MLKNPYPFLIAGCFVVFFGFLVLTLSPSTPQAKGINFVVNYFSNTNNIIPDVQFTGKISEEDYRRFMQLNNPTNSYKFTINFSKN